MRRIASQLADLFARHGLPADPGATVTGRTRTSYRVPLLLRTPAGQVLVDGDLDSPTVDEGAVLRLYLMAVDCGAHAVFLHAGAVAPSAMDTCGDRVTLWPREQAIRLLGETLWNEALGLPPPALPLPTAPAPAPLTTKPDVAGAPEPGPAPAPTESVEVAASTFIDLQEPTAAPAVDLETGVDVVVTTLPTTVADELASAVPLVTPPPAEPVALPPAFQPLPEEPLAPTAAPAAADAAQAADEPGEPTPGEPKLFQLPPAFQPPAAPLQQALPVPDGSRGLLPAQVTLDEARRLVADRLFGIEEWELILQPVHLFDYAVEVLRAGSLQADTQRGLLQVNGTDRKVTSVTPGCIDPPSRVFASPDLTVMDKVLRVSPERAAQLANEWAVAHHGKTVDVNLAGVDDSFDLVERRVIGPTSGQVSLTPLGIWHRPFWRLWGNNGHVDLDAVEGTVLDADLKAADAGFLVVE